MGGTRARNETGAPALVLIATVLGVTALYLMSTIPGVRAPGFEPWLDGWVKSIGYAAAAALALVGAARAPADQRHGWWWVGAALAARAVGFSLHAFYVRDLDPQPYPSVADAAWLMSAVALLVGLVLLARTMSARTGVTLVLDGLVAAAALSSVIVVLLLGTLEDLSRANTDTAVVTNLAYPALDVALLLVVVTVLIRSGWRTSPRMWILTVGLAGSAAVDIVFVYQVSAGTFRAGTLMSSVYLLATVVVAAGAWISRGTAGATALRRPTVPNLVMTMLFSLVCVVVLVIGGLREVPVLGVVLAGCGLALAVVRTFWSFRLVRTVAELTVQLEFERSQMRTLQLQRMESLGRLAGGVAHDFNNLLTVIINYTTMSREALEPEDGQVDDPWVEVREDLENVRLAGERAAELTRQLLRFARRDIAKPEVIDVNALITETAQLVRRSISDDIEFETLLDPAAPIVVIDPGQFEQVVLNLALNARDALPEGGSVTIETRSLDDDVVAIRVIDDGVGMSPELAQRIFEPFFTTKPLGRGTGLGLATVHGIVEQAGGEIAVTSRLGRGTTIEIRLPSATERTSTPSERAGESAPGRGGTILVVDDEPGICALAERILRSVGYVVVTAGSGVDAVRALADLDADVDLLITDIVMPRMSGPEVAERVRALHPRCLTLYMSGYVQDQASGRSALDPSVPLLEKPFGRDHLLRHVAAVLESRAPSPESRPAPVSPRPAEQDGGS